MLLRLPLNLAREPLQTALSGRNGLDLAPVYLRSAKLGFVCARVFRKRQKLPSVSRDKKFDISFLTFETFKGESFEELSTVKNKTNSQ